jgi:Concanavalin A-like lectin/glucanases superfamily/FecR protein/Cadherin-like
LNFVGKFDAKLPVDGPIAHPAMHAHVDGASAHAPSDAIIVPDAQLLFGGEFKRSGVDLVLSDDHHELVLHDYFKGEKRVALASPDGAHLTGDLVNALAGHVEVAQADGAAAAAAVVGHVTKLTGTATAIRNGVSIILNQGDNIDKGDVLQSGADSTLGVTFIDGTVFGLSSNARMVVNEMIYDPNGSNNSSLLSLVAGTISFVAGETAKHGDMKVDTPVATMGIRGTAVLVEIDFDVPGQNGTPSANFQVLVEPDGTTGSYILFDKNTLAPLATVNTAGTLTKISQGIVSFEAGSPLTSDQQKLITDLFTAKFGDSNTKSLFDHFTDSVVPQSLQPVYLPWVTVTPVVLLATNTLAPSPSAPSGPTSGVAHTHIAPHVTIFDQAFGEIPGDTGSHIPHTLSAPITFTDPNSGDRPTVTVAFASFTYQDGHGHDISASLTAQEKAAVAAVEGISLQTAAGNDNNGSAVWTYSFPDSAFDFLGAGETLTLSYTASVNNNYASDQLTGTATFTITITGTNDVPVITSSVPQTIAFVGGTSVPGGDLTAHVPTSGTISFDDPDLTDTHTVSVKLSLNGLDLPPTPLQIFEHALTASIATDSTGSGFGTIKWQLADLPVYLADFIPKGETITLTYVVTVTDSQGATATQDITVTITGSDTPAVVWIATTTTGSPPGGLWSDALKWETGTVPIATDDVIIITNQLIGLTPSYPVTIDANTHAVAKSVTMNDFGTSPPELINLGSLAVDGAFDMSADSILDNSGTISVGGLMEILDTSVLQNSGTLTLEGGGDFAGTSKITNTGTIELSGGTLTVETDIANTGGTIAVDGLGTLTLDGGAIDGGIINISGNIEVSGFGAISNAHLNNGHVTIGSNTTLTLDNDTVTGTSFTDIAVGAVIKIDDGTTLTLSGVTINGGTINDGAAAGTGSIHITGDSTISGASLNKGSVTLGSAKLTLDNDTVTGTSFSELSSGSVISVDASDWLVLAGIDAITGVSGSSIANAGRIEITGTTTLTTDRLINTSAGILKVDATSQLNLSGATIHGGTITDDGTIDVTGASKIDGNAALNGGAVTVDGVLTLDNVTVSGTTIHDNAGIELYDIVKLGGGASIQGATLGAITNNGTLEVAGLVALLNDTLTNTSAIIQVDSTDTLTLNGTEIIGGTITDDGIIHVTGASKIDGNAALDNGTVTVDAVLTLDNVTVSGTTINDNSVIELDHTVKLGGGASIQGNSSTALGAITNNGMLEVTGPATLLNDTLTNTTGGVIQVDDGQTLTLHGTHITGGTINDGTADGTGSIDVTGASAISNADLNHGSVTLSGVTLTLDNDTVTGTSFTDTASGSVIQVDDGTTLTLSGVHITGGAIHDGSAGAGGNINVTADSTFSDTSLNYGHVTIDGGATLTLDDGATIASGMLTIDESGTLNVVHGTAGVAVTLDGSVTNAGLLEATGGGTLHIDGNLSNSGTIEANGGTVVVGADASISGTATVTITNGGLADFVGSSTQTLDLNATFSGTGTLELDNSQHYGGTVNGFVAGDKIDLTDLAYSSSETDVWNSTTHTLTINDGAHSSNIIFSGSYDQNSFALTSDGHGGTDVVMSPAQASMTGLDSVSNAVEGFAAVASLIDANASAFSYQWLAAGVAIPGATGSSYAPLAGHIGETLDVVLGFTDHGTAEQVTALAGTVAAPPAVAINADNTTIDENASLTLKGLKVSFDDAGSDNFTVKLDVIHGTLALDNMAGVSESGAGTSASPFILTGTLTDIDNALHSGLVYTPTTGYYGSDTLTFEAHDGAFTANTATATIDVAPLPPVLSSMTLDVVQGGTELLTNADFSVTDPNGSNFLYTVGNVTGGQFEVFNGENWVVAQTGGFTTAQIEAHHVEFVQDGSATPPNFSITAADCTSNTVSAPIAPTVSFAAAPAASLDFDGHSAAVGPVATSHVGNAAGGAADGITLQGWVDWSGQGDVGNNQLLFYNGNPSDAGFGMNGVVTANGLDLEIQHGGTGGTDMHITLSAGQWYDLALTHVNGVFTLYVDGVDVYSGTRDVGGIPGAFADNTLVGGNIDANGGVNEGFHGSIADVGVWNTALTQSQIQANEFISLPQGNESGLAAYFPLNDGGGTTAHDATNSAGNLSVTGDAPVWQTAAHSIAGGGALDLPGAIASDQAVAFQGPTGSLILDAPASFAGEISGFTGNGTLSGSDHIDLKGINLNSGAFTESYNATTDTLSVSDGTNSALLHFNGIYQAANFSFTTDGAGGTIVYDPPVANNPGAKAQAATATSHGFVFNFADNGNAAANANHPAADTHWFDGQLFANAEAILNKLHDDNHGNATAPPDSHEALTAAGFKAQWHAHDFHFV